MNSINNDSAVIQHIFEWRQDRPAARVNIHVAGVHDHHHKDLATMNLIADGDDTGDRWRAEIAAPRDLCSGYIIAAVPQDFITTFEGDNFDARTRWLALEEYIVEEGRIFSPDAPPRLGWNDSELPSWRTEVIGGTKIWYHTELDAEVLLMVCDGQKWASTTLIPTLQRLNRNNVVPKISVVAVDTSVDRAELLSCNPEFRRFIVENISVAFRQSQAQKLVIAGQSLGGLAAVDIALDYPAAISAVIANSGSFWYPEWGTGDGGATVHKLQNTTLLEQVRQEQVSFHFSVGTSEGGMVSHSQAVVEALRFGGIDVSFEVTNSTHEMVSWEGALTRGIIALFGC